MGTLLDVLCVGSATADTIARAATMPGRDQRILTDPFVHAGGGPAATAAVALARQGIRVGFCGVVGDDPVGHRVVSGLAAEGVNVDWVEVRAGHRTCESLIIIPADSPTRTIITTPSAVPDPAHIPTDVSAWIHVDQTGYAPVRAALLARPSAAHLSIDAGNPIPDLDLTGVSLYAPTETALLGSFPGKIPEALQAAHAAGATHTVATAGGDGAYVRDAEGVHLVPGFTVAITSTMGAGDVFHGALLAGLVEGLPLSEATRRANAVAALSCRGLDGRSAIPTREATIEFLATTTDFHSAAALSATDSTTIELENHDR
ncbi:carbohydrate kinase family protein [Mycetocola tolaasinivorans]|uniref:carbohydrate kinase family protein n=1 Tax=Mycetocola tolaasinivorans TaxID=76635 RepID=UPI001FE49806|nr:PfkB family carbohydrate kinase [Mycetocola tolaasinivorans]